MENKIKIKQSLLVFTRAGLWLTIVSVVGLIVVFSITRNTTNNVVYNSTLELVWADTTLQAQEIDQWIHSTKQTVGALAAMLQTLSSEADFEAVATQFVHQFYFIENAFIGFLDGRLINGTAWEPIPGWYLKERPWFIAAYDAGPSQLIITEPHVSLATGAVVVSVSTYVPSLSGIGAVVSAHISISTIVDLVHQHNVPEGGFLALVDLHGYTIAHPQGIFTPYVSPVTGELYQPNVASATEGYRIIMAIEEQIPSQIFNSDFVGESYLIKIFLESVDWVLTAIVPTSVTTEPVALYTRTILTPIIVLFIIMLAMSLLFIAHFMRHQDMRQVVLEAEEDVHKKDRFIARVSHEIRTPISAILGISEIELQQPNHNIRIEESFAKIHDSASTLLGIINDILDFSKIEAGKMPLVHAAYELQNLVSDVSQLHLAYQGNKQLAFYLEVNPNIPARLYGDIVRLKQVINNLLSNAFKYTEEGLIKLNLDFAPIDNGVMLTLTVQDTGIGMTPEQLETLYTEYARFHKDQGSIIGTGLGMSIVYSLVQLMEGDITIQSQPNVGTTVAVTVPQEASDYTPIGEETAQSLERFELSPQASLKKFNFVPAHMPHGKVLVVDDIDANLYVTRGLLQFYKLQIETCNSGVKALALVEAGNVYDLIFMDQTMPELTGTETMQKLRAMGYTKPIVVLTANALIGHSEEFIRNGFDGFISKPINTNHLNTILVKFIGTPKGDAGAQAGNKFLSDPKVIQKLRTDFAKVHGGAMQTLQDSLDQGDIATAHRMAHSLKGLAGLINEPALANCTREIELILARGEALCPILLDGAAKELARVVADIRTTEIQAQIERSKASQPSQTLDRATAQALLQQLHPMLQSRNMAAIDMVDQLRKIPGTKTLIEEIQSFAFAKALWTLETIIKGDESL